MTERRCGYCREYNHTFTLCPLRLSLIDTIQRHVAIERIATVKTLIANGYGAGAIANCFNYRKGEYEPCAIADPNEAIYIDPSSMVDYNKRRYSKQVYVKLFSSTGNFPIHNSHQSITQCLSHQLSFRAIPIASSESPFMATIECSYLTDRTYLGGGMKSYNRKDFYSWEHYSSLLVPSYDGEVDMERVMQPFHIHERLTRNGGKVSPIV